MIEITKVFFAWDGNRTRTYINYINNLYAAWSELERNSNTPVARFGGKGEKMEHKREVKSFCWFQDQDGRVRPKEGQRFVYESEFHGDHDLDWIVVYEGDKEVERHNPKMMGSIYWK